MEIVCFIEWSLCVLLHGVCVHYCMEIVCFIAWVFVLYCMEFVCLIAWSLCALLQHCGNSSFMSAVIKSDEIKAAFLCKLLQ